jgi:hypothetical protein
MGRYPEDIRSTEGFTPEVERTLGESRSIQDESASRNQPANVLSRLNASLPKMHKGGVVKATGPVILKKGETVIPAPQDAQNPPTQDDSDSMSDETAVSGSHNLQRAYSKLNEAVRAMLDGLGIRRSASIPHSEGQSMADHLSEVGQVMASHGQISGNIMTATHSVHDKDGGSTVGHPNPQLLQTIVPKDSELAKAAINACRTLISKSESLIGETPEIQRAKSQIALLSKSDGQGMSAFDLSAALLNIPGAVIQSLARKHSQTAWPHFSSNPTCRKTFNRPKV